MKCRIKDLRFYEGDVLILDGHKHTVYRQHATGSVEFFGWDITHLDKVLEG
ncbi:hypothetical protein [Citrobacter phage Tr1]|nr:hypothetical protein [Citrobacter phage Tr1]